MKCRTVPMALAKANRNSLIALALHDQHRHGNLSDQLIGMKLILHK
jgi:hypothetical protein